MDQNFFTVILESAQNLTDLLKGKDADTINNGVNILNYQIDSIIENIEIFLEFRDEYSKSFPEEVSYIAFALNQLKAVREKEKELERIYGKAVVVGPKMGNVINTTKMGGKRKTRKMRGGKRGAASRAPPRSAAAADNNSNLDNNNSNLDNNNSNSGNDEGGAGPMTWGEAEKRANAIAKISQAELNNARARTKTQKIRRQEFEETVAWSFKNLMLGLVATVAAVTGAGVAASSTEMAAYGYSAVTDAIHEASSKIPFLGIEGPKLNEYIIPRECMPTFIEGHLSYVEPPAVKFDPTVSIEWKGTTDLLGEAFSETVGTLLEAPTVTEWPAYEAQLKSAFVTAEKAKTTCEVGRSLWQKARRTGCTDEIATFDAADISYKSAKSVGLQLTPQDLKYKSGDLTATVTALGKGAVSALDLKDRASAEKARELVTVFESTSCSGLPVGTGVLKPELLATLKGYVTAQKTCTGALETVLPPTENGTTYDPVVTALANTFRAANDVRISLARDNVMILREQGEMTENFVRVVDQRQQRGKVGINLLINTFEIKKSRAKSLDTISEDDRSRGVLSRTEYQQIINNLRLADTQGIKIPNDVVKVSEYAAIIENTYTSYIAVGRTVPMSGTREFNRTIYAKGAAGWKMGVFGGVAGLAITAALAFFGKLGVLAGVPALAYSAALGQRGLNALLAQQENAKLIKMRTQIRLDVLEGTLDPVEGKRRLAAVMDEDPATSLKLLDQLQSQKTKKPKRKSTTRMLENRTATAASSGRGATSAPRLTAAAANAATVPRAQPALTNAPAAAAANAATVPRAPLALANAPAASAANAAAAPAAGAPSGTPAGASMRRSCHTGGKRIRKATRKAYRK
jgi:hypothetical protein